MRDAALAFGEEEAKQLMTLLPWFGALRSAADPEPEESAPSDSSAGKKPEKAGK